MSVPETGVRHTYQTSSTQVSLAIYCPGREHLKLVDGCGFTRPLSSLNYFSAPISHADPSRGYILSSLSPALSRLFQRAPIHSLTSHFVSRAGLISSKFDILSRPRSAQMIIASCLAYFLLPMINSGDVLGSHLAAALWLSTRCMRRREILPPFTAKGTSIPCIVVILFPQL